MMVAALLLLLTGACPAIHAATPEPAAQEHGSSRVPKRDPEHVLIRFKASAARGRREAIIARHGLGKESEIESIGVRALKLPRNVTPEEMIERLKAEEGDIEFAEVNALHEPTYIPDDPQYSSQWHLPKINATSAWNVVRGSGVVLAVADTGTDWQHPDLIANLINGWNYYDGNSNTDDVVGHGTLVAGIAAAVGDNGLQMAGVSYDSKVIVYRVGNPTTGAASTFNLAQAITDAADRGAKAVNLSYSGVNTSLTIADAAAYMYGKGGLTVTANANDNVYNYAVNNPDLVSAGATDSGDAKASFSTFGSITDVAAPGVSVCASANGGGTRCGSGTSFSAPNTMGVLGLLWSFEPAFTPEEAQYILYKSAKDLGTPGYDTTFGWGRIDAGAAMVLAGKVATSTYPVSVLLLSPTHNTALKGVVNLRAAPVAGNGVSKVEFYVDGALKGSDTSRPYEQAWDSAADGIGPHSLMARAFDSAGNASTHTISVVVDTAPPTVSLGSLLSGSTVSKTITLSASASDSVSSVVYIDISTNGTRVAKSNSGSTGYAWNTLGLPEKAHTIRTYARDKAGNGGSIGVTVYVCNASCDASAPSVGISTPLPNDVVSGTVAVKAAASDDTGISRVQFFVDGVIKATDTTSPYAYSWNTRAVPNGSHAVTAKAVDIAGKSSSTMVTVVVDNGLDAAPPSIPSGLAATAVSSTQINLSWNPSIDDVGVAGYKVFRCQGDGCSPALQVATRTTTGLTDAGLTPETTYAYRVSAFDAAGNVSALSSQVGARTKAAALAGGVISTLNADGSFFWLQDPHAIRSTDKTYVAWTTKEGDAVIAAFDHVTRKTASVTLHNNLQVDDHAMPALFVLPDRRLLVFYAGNRGQLASIMKYRISTNPEDISSWGPEKHFDQNTPGDKGFAYPNVVQLSGEANALYLFWRGGNWLPSFSKSTDGGSTWSAPKTLVNNPGQRPYIKYASDGAGRIHFAFTTGGPGEVGASNSLYSAYYQGGALYKADGAFIKNVAGLPLSLSDADMVYDAASGLGAVHYIQDMALDPSGKPVIVYATYTGVLPAVDFTYRYARWDGSAWRNSVITAGGGPFTEATTGYWSGAYAGGIALDHNDPSAVYLSKETGGFHEIEKWTTGDGGATWAAESITSGSTSDNYRPIVPRGHTGGEMDVLWSSGRYTSYRDFDASIQAYPLSTASDIAAPVITNLRNEALGMDSVTIAWGTNEPATTQIDYGATPSFGSMTGEVSELATTHGQPLTGLLPGTLYHYRAKSRDAAGNITWSGGGTFVTAASTAASAPFLESGGKVTVEAEHYETSISRDGVAWTQAAALTGYSADGYMEASPNTGKVCADSTCLSTSAELQYRINFSNPGTYLAWVRGSGASGTDDSVHLGIDGIASYSDRASKFPASWTWSGSRMDGLYPTGITFHVTTGGLHTLNLWMREDGFRVDKIYLTNDTFVATPAPSGMGPPESPRGDDSPPSVAITAPVSGSTVSGTVAVSASGSDDVGVVGVRFKLDGFDLGPEDGAPPFFIPWNTSSTPDGPHALTAVARDAAGNVSTSAAAVVTVDNMPPSTPDALAALALSSAQINLSWNPSTDDVGVAGYKVFRCQGAGCSPALQIATRTTPGLTDAGLTPDTTYVYRVSAFDAAGNVSALSAQVGARTEAAAVMDTTPPSVSITAPADGDTVFGSITLEATASDDVGVLGVQFRLDGIDLGAEGTTPPYSMSWNTTPVPDGIHTLTAAARDAAGNVSTSAAVSVTVDNAPGGKPNIVVIMTDDQDARSLAGMTTVQNLLVAEGVSFSSSYVNFPLCCPSRATLFTGQCAQNHGVLNNGGPDGGYAKLAPTADNILPRWLQDAGYFTAHIGKYLNGYGTQVPPTTLPPGWNKWATLTDRSTDYIRYYNYTLNEDGALHTYGTSSAAYQTTVLTEKALEFIGSRSGSGQPFFLALEYFAPHGDSTTLSPVPAPGDIGFHAATPLPKPPAFNEADVSDKPAFIGTRFPVMSAATVTAVTDMYRARLEALRAVDRGVKKVLDALQAIGALDNTVVIFTSDNGYFHGEHRKPGGKYWVYDPSVRVPLVIRGPGIARGEIRERQLVTNVDLAPTILDFAAGAAGRLMDGRSLRPLLSDPSVPWRTGFIFEGIDMAGTTSMGRYKAVHTNRYVYAEHTSGEKELYDLAVDPYQLASKHADTAYATVRSSLAATLAALKTCAGKGCWMTSAEPPPPSPDTTPPSIPTGLAAAAISSTQINLAWNPSTDDVGVAGYKVFRCQGAGCSPALQIATRTATGLPDAGLAPGTTYVYRVSAFDEAGNVSALSAQVGARTKAAALTDTTPPSVSITAPADGDTVFGSITVAATASDDVGVLGVQFRLDGIDLGAEGTAPPYSVSWNTTPAPDGIHTLTAVARDAAGNVSTSAAVSVAVDNAPGGKPNIVVIMTDDQDARSLAGMTTVQNLLVAEGVSFSSSYVNFPLCCPSRATLFTGQCAQNHGVLDNTGPDGGYAKLAPTADNTLPRWLQDAGYFTAHIGKYLNGYGTQVPPTTLPPGWNKWATLTERSTDHIRYYNYTLNEDGELHTYGTSSAAYQTTVLTEKALEFIGSRSGSGQPFFLALEYFAPHSDANFIPIPAPGDIGFHAATPLPKPPAFNEADVSDKPAFIGTRFPVMSAATVTAVTDVYRARLEALRAVDRGVKKVLDALQAIGALDNTIIIFTSDNGYFHGEHRKPWGKLWVYDPSVRVPLVIRGPGIARGETRDRQLVTNVDLAPTILDFAAGAAGRLMDGRSLRPLLSDPSVPWRTGFIFEGIDKVDNSVNMTTLGRYKAVHTNRYVYAEHTSGEKELYDLAADPYQLASKHADTAYAAVRSSLAATLAALKTCAGTSCWMTSAEPPPPDTTPPSGPTGLAAAAISSTQINLAWNPSTDDVGVASYKVFRCQGAGCSPALQIATRTVTGLPDAGLAPGTTYVYRVSAFDEAGNVSALSASASTRTPPAPAGYLASVLIGTSGGSVGDLASLGVLLSVPPGALSESATFYISPEDTSNPALQASKRADEQARGMSRASPAFDIRAAGSISLEPVSSFPIPLELSMAYDPGQVSAPSALGLFYWDTRLGRWQAIAGAGVKPSGAFMEAQLAHLTTFAVFQTASLSAGSSGPLAFGQVFAYPNPAHGGKITLHAEIGPVDSLEIKIYDLKGVLLHRTRLSGPPSVGINGRQAYEYSWDLSGVAAGTYLYSIKAVKAGQTAQILKKLAVLR